MANRSEVMSIVVSLMDCYSEKKISNLPGFIDTMTRLLGDIPADDLRRAADEHMMNSKWFPSVAELRIAARKLPALAMGPQVRPLTPNQKAEIHTWGLFVEGNKEIPVAKRAECRRIEKFEWYASMDDCPQEERAEYQRWLDWFAAQRA